MSIRMTEHELHNLGLRIDPENPTEAIPVASDAKSLPDESWDLEKLALYAATGLSEANRLQKESIELGRRSTIQIFRAGGALSIARRKVQWGEWGTGWQHTTSRGPQRGRRSSFTSGLDRRKR